MQLSNKFDICFVFFLSMRVLNDEKTENFIRPNTYVTYDDYTGITIVSEFISLINLADAFSFHARLYVKIRYVSQTLSASSLNMQHFYRNKITIFHPQRILCFSSFDCRRKPLLSNIPSISMILVHATLNRNEYYA